MPYVIDAVVLITIIVVTIAGIRKGIVKAAAEFIGSVVSAIFSSWIGSIVADWVFTTFFKQGLYDRILSATSGKNGPAAVTGLFDSLPDFLIRLLEQGGITQSSVTRSLGGAATDIADVITAALSPVFISIIRIFAVIILFILFMLIVKGISSLLNGIKYIPIISQLNGLLGGIFGFLFSLTIIWLILALCSFLLPVMDAGIRKSIEEALSSSILTKLILSINPLHWIFNS